MRTRRLMLVSLCALMGALAFAVAPAIAFQTHEFEGSFGPDGTTGTSFQRAMALALDQSTGNVYVGDVIAGSVEKFNLAHEPEPFTGMSLSIVEGKLPVSGFQYNPADQLAVNPTSHDLYVEGGSVRAYESNGDPVDFTAGPGVGTNEISGSEVCGVAVDSSGDIYMSEFKNGIRVFAKDGEPIVTIPVSSQCNLAVAPTGVVYANAPAEENTNNYETPGPIQKFTPSEFPVTASTTYKSTTVDANPSFAVAVDPSIGNLYVDEGNKVAEYDEAGERLGTFGASEPGALPDAGGYGAGLAVNSVSGQVYVAQDNDPGQVYVFGPMILVPDVTTGKAIKISPKGTATLTGMVKPDGVALTECYFEYVEAARYEPAASDPYAAGVVAQCVPAAGEIPVAGETEVQAKLTGLTPGVTYHFRLVASNKMASNKNPANDGDDETFAPPPRPLIVPDSATATNVTATSAELSAEINPGGLETSYYFEYDTKPYNSGEGEHAHGTSVAGGVIPAGTGNVMLPAVHVTGLSAENITYYWRVVASNEAGTTIGVDHMFVYNTSGEGLPDNRAYEMVTPPHKNASLIGGTGGILTIEPAIAEDGSRLMVSNIQCFGGAESCVALRGQVGQPLLFTRTAAGWTATALQPAARQFEADTEWLFSVEAGTALFSMPTPPMYENDLYAREANGGPGASFADIGPLTPPSEGPQGQPFGTSGAGFQATADLSRVAYNNSTELHQALEFSGSGNPAPQLVGVSGGEGSEDLISSCSTEIGHSTFQVPGVMSADGETLYFTAEQCPAGTGANAKTPAPVNEVFARVGEARTVAISEPQAPQIPGGPGPHGECAEAECVKNTESPPAPAVNPSWREASFAGASADGSRAFFTSAQQLTDNAGQGEGANLYESECTAGCEGPASEERRSLIDASEASGGGKVSGGGPRVEGVVAISGDGSHVYFVAQGVLTAAPNRQGEVARDGANNLYVFERDADHPEGATAFIAQLPQADSEQWGHTIGGRANVTPDGRFLVFESQGDLTPDATRTDGAVQIYRYDAQTGELIRLSIGERGFNDDGNAGLGDAKLRIPFVGWSGQASPQRSDPTMSHDGRFVFFESPIGLTPAALDDVQIGTRGGEPAYAENVYEWHEGQVYLISDGRDTSAVYGGEESGVKLIGTDATGANVFFTTADQLVPQDIDTQVDFYDARICEPENGSPCIQSAPPPLPPCLGEACHGIPATQPAPPSGGTLTFNGAGNLAPGGGPSNPPTKVTKKTVRCRRGFTRKKTKKKETCVKRPVKKSKKAKKSTRRAK
jgi:hypothetical protein